LLQLNIQLHEKEGLSWILILKRDGSHHHTSTALYFQRVFVHSFCLFSIFFRTIHSFIHPFAEGTHCFPLSGRHPWGAEPGFELGPAVPQADALLSELSRTLNISTVHKPSKNLSIITYPWGKMYFYK
jgi:hypothetical protein